MIDNRYMVCTLCKIRNGAYLGWANEEVVAICRDCFHGETHYEEAREYQKCSECKLSAHELTGSWNKDPYLFFCSESCHEKYLQKEKPHRKIPDKVRQICWLYDAWIVGGAVDFVTGKSSSCNDIDIVVPLKNWINASKLIATGSKANHYGGYKFEEDGFSIDVWPDDVGQLLMESHKPIRAYNLKHNKVIGVL